MLRGSDMPQSCEDNMNNEFKNAQITEMEWMKLWLNIWILGVLFCWQTQNAICFPAWQSATLL